MIHLCFTSVHWKTGRASGLQKNLALINDNYQKLAWVSQSNQW